MRLKSTCLLLLLMTVSAASWGQKVNEDPPPENAQQKNEDSSDEPDISLEDDDAVDESKEPLPRIQIKREKVEYKKEGTRYIEHPNAAKGLVKITRDKTYIYKTEKSPQTRAAAVHFGPVEFNELENPDSEFSATFYDNYDQTEAPMVVIDYEWQIMKTAIGKLGITAGTGFYFANGHGHFENTALEPKESFTFIMIPLSGGLVYRMQLWDKMPLVPFGVGGISLLGFTEIRDDDKGPKFGGAAAAYAGGGAAFNMNFLDTWSMLEMDRDYGINSVYLVGEFRKYIGLTNYDFSSDLISGGFLVEF